MDYKKVVKVLEFIDSVSMPQDSMDFIKNLFKAREIDEAMVVDLVDYLAEVSETADLRRSLQMMVATEACHRLEDMVAKNR